MKVKKNNRNVQLLMSSLILGSIVSLATPQESVEASKPNFLAKNVIPVKGGEYELQNGFPVPIALRVTKEHPDYEYLSTYNLRAKDGYIYLYLQSYKGEIYHYSPILREHKDGGPFKEDGVNRDVREKLKGTDLWPINSAGNGYDWLRSNTIGKTKLGLGVTNNSKFTDATKSVVGLHHRRPSGTIDYNFSRKTALPPARGVWSPNNLRDTDNHHKDTYQRYYKEWRYGEYREIGYHPSGMSFVNPYFPMDGMRDNGSKGFEDYDLLQYPWGRLENRNKGHLISEMDEKAYQYNLYMGHIPLNEKVNPHESRTHSQNVDKSINWKDSSVRNDYKRAYDAKWYSIEQAYDRTPALRNNKKLKGMTRNQAIRNLTRKFASLSSSPIGTDANSSISFGRTKTANNIWYSITLTIPGKIKASRLQDTQIKQQRVYDGGLLQTFDRYKSGGKYTTSLTNNSGVGMNYPEVTPGSRIRVETLANIEDSYTDKTRVKGILHMHNSENTKKFSYNLPDNGPIHKNGSTFIKWVTVPNNVVGEYSIHTELNKNYYNTAYDMYIDSTENTAVNKLEVERDQGEFVSTGIDLIDENNRVVEQPIPGHSYKIRYKYKYTGSIASNVTRTANVRLSYDIGREMRGDTVSGHETQGKRSLAPSNTSSNSRLYSGKVFHFDTPYHIYETGQLDTNSTLNADIHDEIRVRRSYTSCNKDGCWTSYYTEILHDYYSLDAKSGKDWSTDYDLSVENVTVIPTSIENSHDQYSPTLVKFDINYKTPSFIKDLGKDIDVSVKVGNQVVETKQHVRDGLNRNISIPVDTLYRGNQNSVIDAEIFINPNKKVYESDDGIVNIKSTNNYGTGRARVNRPTVVPFKNSNNYASWNQYYSKNNWQGQHVQYRSFSGPQINFNRFTDRDNQRSEYRRYFEQYQIDGVRFRSRLTRQEKMGPNRDGWVDLLREDGIIKAGYGYELEIDVSYKTDADINDLSKAGLNGNWSRPRLTEPLLQDNIYVQLPNNVIRSVQGDSGTEGKLRVKSTQGDKLNKKWTFEIDGGSSLGVDTTGRFYIGQDVRDGRYSMNIFTPKIRGVNGKMTSAHSILEHLLYDSKNNLGIQVIGADVDDITDHINK